MAKMTAEKRCHSLPSFAVKVQRRMRGGLKNKMVVDVNHELFKKLISGICDIYGDRLISIILYGSVARNTATIDSDIDIALLVKNDDPFMHDRMLDVLTDLDLEYDQVLSPSIIEKDQYDKWKAVLPYYRNIEKEGVVLWTAA